MTTAVVEAGKVLADARIDAVRKMEPIVRTEKLQGFDIVVDSKHGKFIVMVKKPRPTSKK